MSRLRLALLLDALLTVVTAPVLVLAAAPIASLTGLPLGLVRGAGIVLVVWAGWFPVVLRHDPPRPGPVEVVLVVNVLWVLASVVVALGAAGRPTGAGVAFVAVQAAAVAGLTVAQVRTARAPLPVTVG